MRSRFALRFGLPACAALALILPACENGGHFSLFGYRTGAAYRPNICTVRVPIFKNHTYYQGLEFQLTRAVVAEIAKTPYRVVTGNEPADTELTGNITALTKGVVNINNVNEVRDLETTMIVEITWRDLRTGEYLSKPPRRPGEIVEAAPTASVGPQPLEPLPGTRSPTILTPPTGPVAASPGTNNSITITTSSNFIPELGGSLATSAQVNILKTARQIVELMEAPW